MPSPLTINVASININGLNSDQKVKFLSDVLATKQHHAAFIQETWSTEKATQLTINKQGHHSNPTNLKGRGGKNDGLMIIPYNKLQYPIKLLQKGEFFIKVQIGNIIISNIYLPPRLTQRSTKETLELLKDSDIIMGDFNFRKENLGDTISNKKDRFNVIKNFMAIYRLKIVKPQKNTKNNHVFAKHGIVNRVTCTQIPNEISDHELYLTANININEVPRSQRTGRRISIPRNIEDPKANRFREAFEHEIKSIIFLLNNESHNLHKYNISDKQLFIDNVFNSFQNIIINLAHEKLGSHSVRSHKQNTKNKNILLHTYDTRGDHIFPLISKCMGEGNSVTADLDSIYKKYYDQYRRPDYNNVNVQNVLYPTHSPLSPDIQRQLMDYITPDRILQIIKRTPSRKAGGPDELKPILLKILCYTPKSELDPKNGEPPPPTVVLILHSLLKLIVIHNIMPSSWNISSITPIPKGDSVVTKDNHTKNANDTLVHKEYPTEPTGKPKDTIDNSKEYRPITVINFTKKIFELCFRSFLIRSECMGNKYTKTSPQQAGFKPGYSTLTHAAILTERIRTDKAPFVAFLDLKKAYDYCYRPHLYYNLKKRGIDPAIIYMISLLIENNYSIIRLNGKTSPPFGRLYGIPQGDILAPDLFNIYIDPLLEELGTSALAFADDIALTNINAQVMQSKLHICTTWAANTAMEFNTTKSLIMSEIRNTQFTLANAPLMFCEEYKYLGFPFKLNIGYQPDIHIHNNLKRMIANRQKFARIGYTSHIRDSLHPKVKLLIFKAFIRSMLEYGWALMMADLKKADMIKYEKILDDIQSEYRNNVSIICSSARVDQDPKVFYSITGLENEEYRLYHLQYKLAVHFFRSDKDNPIWEHMPRPARIALNDIPHHTPQLVRPAAIFNRGMSINTMLGEWINELIKTCPRSMANYTGIIKIPNNYPEDKFTQYKWSCCDPCFGHKQNLQYYDVKDYDINTTEISTIYDPSYISSNTYNYSHNNHLRSRLLLSWHPLRQQKRKKRNPPASNTTITTYFTSNRTNTLTPNNSSNTLPPNTRHNDTIEYCRRIPPFARTDTLSIRNLRFCDKITVYKAIMYRANSNPYRFNCFKDHESSNHRNNRNTFRQHHLNECVIPWISDKYPEILHHKLKTIESILNHNKMELFHIISAIAMTLCLRQTDERINDVFMALLSQVLMVDVIHKIINDSPLKPILDDYKNNIIGIIDINKILSKEHITEILEAFNEYTIDATILFIPTGKIKLLQRFPNSHILFTTKEDHNFFKDTNTNRPNPFGSYSLVLSCISDEVYKNFYYKFPTLAFTIYKIGSIAMVHSNIITISKRHSSRTVAITDPDAENEDESNPTQNHYSSRSYQRDSN